jgi:hypothetical protein
MNGDYFRVITKAACQECTITAEGFISASLVEELEPKSVSVTIVAQAGTSASIPQTIIAAQASLPTAPAPVAPAYSGCSDVKVEWAL